MKCAIARRVRDRRDLAGRVTSPLAARASLLALVALACTGGAPQVPMHLGSPTSIVSFNGVTNKSPIANGQLTVHPYFAVASSASNEIEFVDQYDLQAVVGPGLVFPLAVNTDPRPLLLASASLGDGGADVLVAVSAGETDLQVIDTWDENSIVAYSIPLDIPGTGPNSAPEIIALKGMPARPATATAAAVPARILAAVDTSAGPSSGMLITVEFGRATDGKSVVSPPTGFPAVSAANVTSLGFRPSDIALEPGSLGGTRPDGSLPTQIYIATRDPVTSAGDLGVAVLDTLPPGGTALTSLLAPIVAKAGTVALAAGYVNERVPSAGFCSTETFSGTPVLYVYAALDPNSCGVNEPVNCGLATLDPRTHLLATDPATLAQPLPSDVPLGPVAVPTQSYRAPMPIPGVPTHVAIAFAPALGNQRLYTVATGSNVPATNTNVPSPTCPTTAPTDGATVTPLFEILPGTGERYTSAAAAVTSADGRVYWYDLGRWGPPSDQQEMTITTTRVQVIAASTQNVGPNGSLPGGQPGGLGLWNDVAADTSNGLVPLAVVTDQLDLENAIDVWPGFTPTDTWSVVYQGVLPQLGYQPVEVLAGGGNGYVAFQTFTLTDPALTPPTTSLTSTELTTSSNFAASVNVLDPSLGVRVGDSVLIYDPASGSGAAPLCETTVAALVAADPQGTLLGVSLPAGAVELAPASCLAGLLPAAGSPTPFVVEAAAIRANGFVLGNAKQGYLGRPELNTDFALAWQDETTLTGEALAVARKARRLFYPSEGPCPMTGSVGAPGNLTVGCYTGFARITDPLSPGPVVRFRLGQFGPNAPVRDDAVLFNTQQGLVQSARTPLTGGAFPTGVVPFDWTVQDPVNHGNDGIRFVTLYLDDQILAFSPGGTFYDFTIH